MKKIDSRSLLSLALLAFTFCGVRAVHAQYAFTVGTAPGGGNTVVGNGNLLSLVTQPPLSAGGNDLVTLNAGSNLSIAAGTAIQFTTQPDTVILLGAINIAGSGNGVFFTSGNGSSVTNKGSITIGGNGNAIQFVNGDNATAVNSGPISITGNGVGIYFGSGNNATVSNSSTISIGTSGEGIFLGSGDGAKVSSSGAINLGASGNGIQLNSGNNASVNSSAAITISGNGAGIFLNSGNGAIVTSSGPINIVGSGDGIQLLSGNNAVVNNSASISVGAGGNGIFLNSGNDAVVTSSGAILIGSSGNGILLNSGDRAKVTSSASITLLGNGAGIFLNSGNNATIMSSGPINITGSGDAIQLNSGNNATVFASSSISVGAGGAGIFLSSGNNATVISSAVISVGSGGGNGIYLGSGDGATVGSSGAIQLAGNGNAIFLNSGNNSNVTNSGMINVVGNGAGIFLGTGNNSSIINSGMIVVGGNGDGIQLNNGLGATVANSGSVLLVGNGNGVFFGGGSGHSLVNLGTIGLQGAGFGVFSSGGNNNTLTNLGSISGGSDGKAINFIGNNSTINLNGHSSVFGLISASGAANSNVLNLNFTGMSPAAIAALKAQFAAQGIAINTGVQSSGFFTVRGVNYTYDPLDPFVNVSSYQLQGLTPNQAAVGASLDSATVNPAPGSPLFKLFNAIDASGNVPQALEALSPQKYQVFGDIAESTATFMSLSIDDRLNNLRDGSESVDTTGIGGGNDVTTTAGYDKDGKTVVVPDQKALERRWGFFAQGSGEFTNIDAHGGDLTDSHFTSAGLTLGLDAKVCDHFVAGLLFNYTYTTADLDNVGSKANVQTLGGGIYTGFHDGGWYANGLAAYGSNDYNSTRNILFPGFANQAQGSTNGNQEEVNIDGGYDFHLTDKLSAGPLAGLQYVHLNVDGFNENGAGVANLAVGSQTVDSLRSRIGVHVQYRTDIAKDVTFGTEIHAAWQHEFLDDSRAISGAFIGSGLSPFSVQTTNPQRDSALAGLSANITIRDRMTLFVDYDVQAGQQSYLEQSVKGGIRIGF